MVDRLSPVCCCGAGCKIGTFVLGEQTDPMARWDYITPNCLDFEGHESANFDTLFSAVELCGNVRTHDYQIISQADAGTTSVEVLARTNTGWELVAAYESAVGDETGALALTERNSSGVTGTVTRLSFTGSEVDGTATMRPISANNAAYDIAGDSSQLVSEGWRFPGSLTRMPDQVSAEEDCYILSWVAFNSEESVYEAGLLRTPYYAVDYTVIAEANANLDIGTNTLSVRVNEATGITLKKGTTVLAEWLRSELPDAAFSQQAGYVIKRDGNQLWLRVDYGYSEYYPDGPRSGQTVPIEGLGGVTLAVDACEGLSTNLDNGLFETCMPSKYYGPVSAALTTAGFADGRYFGVLATKEVRFRENSATAPDNDRRWVATHPEGLHRQGCVEPHRDEEGEPCQAEEIPKELHDLLQSLAVTFDPCGTYGSGGCEMAVEYSATTMSTVWTKWIRLSADDVTFPSSGQGCPTPCKQVAADSPFPELHVDWDYENGEHVFKIRMEWTGGGAVRTYDLTIVFENDVFPASITVTEEDFVLTDGNPGNPLEGECPCDGFTIEMVR